MKNSLSEIERLTKENKELQHQLQKALETIDAIKTGNIDALVVPALKDLKVYTEQTADKIYRTLIEKMHEGAVTLSEEGAILYCNAYFANMIKLPLQKVLGEKFELFIEKSSRESFSQLFKAGIEKAVKKEIFLITYAGNTIPVLMSVTTLTTDNDFVLSVIITDLTVQNKNQQELKIKTKELEQKNIELQKTNQELAYQIEEKVKREVERKKDEKYIGQLAAIVESSDDAIISKSLDGIIKSWNKGSEKMFGYSAKEAIGKHISLIIPSENIGEENNILKRIRNNEIVHYETIRKKKSGELFHVSITVSPLKDREGKIIGASKIARDITFLKKSEEEKEKRANELILVNKELALQNKEKEKRAKELSDANKDLTTFTYVSSHDLQEPLRKIQNFVTAILLEDEKRLSETGKGYFVKMRETAKRMQSLIEDLLTYSRTKSDDRIFENTNLNSVLDEVLSDLDEIIKEQNGTIEAKPLGNANIIPFQFRQLFQNLISNSLKFAKPGTPPHILVESKMIVGDKSINKNLSAKKNYLRITFTDNGIGFDSQYEDRIFEVFQRLHTFDKYKGTGIGLAICKRIVENHHGVITATGNPGKGAKFDIYIPVE
jgi:PAS domain S-box-containing protein